MLTVEEINEVQGLLKYMENLKHLKPNDIVLIDANGEEAAVVGLDTGGDGYVLKSVT